MFGGGVLAGAIGEPANHGANLVDHLGMIGAQRNVGIGMLGRQFDGGLQCLLDSPAESLGQRLDDRNALAVAAKRVSQVVPGIGIVRLCRQHFFAPGGDGEKLVELVLLVGLDVVGPDHGGLVGGVVADQADRQPRLDRLVEVALVK